jgi:hypothetical protein
VGNQSVGKAFDAALAAIGKESLAQKKSGELLEILDAVGNKFRETDAEFDCSDQPGELLGDVLIKIWGQNLPPVPTVKDSHKYQEEWDDLHYNQVITTFRQRYRFW